MFMWSQRDQARFVTMIERLHEAVRQLELLLTQPHVIKGIAKRKAFVEATEQAAVARSVAPDPSDTL